MLLRLHDFRKRVESHFLDPALETLFAEFNARVVDMIPTLFGVQVLENPDLVRFPKNYPDDPQAHGNHLKERDKIVTKARTAARAVYESYVQLIHECRLKLQISTLDEL